MWCRTAFARLAFLEQTVVQAGTACLWQIVLLCTHVLLCVHLVARMHIMIAHVLVFVNLKRYDQTNQNYVWRCQLAHTMASHPCRERMVADMKSGIAACV